MNGEVFCRLLIFFNEPTLLAWYSSFRILDRITLADMDSARTDFLACAKRKRASKRLLALLLATCDACNARFFATLALAIFCNACNACNACAAGICTTRYKVQPT